MPPVAAKNTLNDRPPQPLPKPKPADRARPGFRTPDERYTDPKPVNSNAGGQRHSVDLERVAEPEPREGKRQYQAHQILPAKVQSQLHTTIKKYDKPAPLPKPDVASTAPRLAPLSSGESKLSSPGYNDRRHSAANSLDGYDNDESARNATGPSSAIPSLPAPNLPSRNPPKQEESQQIYENEDDP